MDRTCCTTDVTARNHGPARALKFGVAIAVKQGMSVLRTISLIAAGALLSLGGSALALFL